MNGLPLRDQPLSNVIAQYDKAIQSCSGNEDILEEILSYRLQCIENFFDGDPSDRGMLHECCSALYGNKGYQLDLIGEQLGDDASNAKRQIIERIGF